MYQAAIFSRISCINQSKSKNIFRLAKKNKTKKKTQKAFSELQGAS